MKTILIASLMIGSAALAQEQNSTPIRNSTEIELTCRTKAKEIAAETYRSCVSDQKSAQIEQIKKEYQNKLQALKAHYEAELKKMSDAKTKASLDEAEATSQAATAPEAPAAPQKSDKKNEQSAMTASKAPVKKASKAAIAPKISSVPKKISKRSGSATSSEMTVRLKPAPVTPPADESVMDLPEPVPVENVKVDSSI